eukprot:gene12055-biopygen2064
MPQPSPRAVPDHSRKALAGDVPQQPGLIKQQGVTIVLPCGSGGRRPRHMSSGCT